MLENWFDLQLFADEATDAAADAATEATESAREKAEKQPAADEKAFTEKKKAAKYTDDDVDDILNRKFAKWQEKQQKAVDEATKLAKMDATQKAKYERDKLQEELNEYKRQAAVAAMMKTARKLLSENNINISDELLSVMVTTDAEETKAAIDSFTTAFHEAVESEVKARLKGETPRKGAGSAPTMTKEQIMSIRDPELRQKKMLENKELFNF